MKKLIYISSLIMLLTSCFEDNTKLGTNTISTLTTELEKRYISGKDDIITIDPKITDQSEQQLLTYKWYVGTKLVSTDKILKYKTEEYGNYECYLYVKDKNLTNVSCFYISVVSLYEKGLFVLSEYEGKSMVSFKTEMKEGEKFEKNILRKKNPDIEFGSNPVDINKVGMSWSGQYILYHSSTPLKTYSIDKKTLEVANEIKAGNKSLNISHITQGISTLMYTNMIADGKVYSYMPSRNRILSFLSNGLPKNYFVENKTIFLTSSDGSGNGVVLFEKTKSQLMWFGSSFRYVNLSKNSFVGSSYINMFGCDKNENVLLFLKSKTEENRLIRYSVKEDMIIQETNVKNVSLTEYSQIAVHSSKPIIYYSNGNKLYDYNYLTNNFPNADENIASVDGTIKKIILSSGGDKLYVAYQKTNDIKNGCVSCFETKTGKFVWEEQNIAGDIKKITYVD